MSVLYRPPDVLFAPKPRAARFDLGEHRAPPFIQAEATNGVDERVIARGWTTKVSALLLGSRSFLNQYARAPFPSLSDLGARAGPLAAYSVR